VGRRVIAPWEGGEEHFEKEGKIPMGRRGRKLRSEGEWYYVKKEQSTVWQEGEIPMEWICSRWEGEKDQ